MPSLRELLNFETDPEIEETSKEFQTNSTQLAIFIKTEPAEINDNDEATEATIKNYQIANFQLFNDENYSSIKSEDMTYEILSSSSDYNYINILPKELNEVKTTESERDDNLDEFKEISIKEERFGSHVELNEFICKYCHIPLESWTSLLQHNLKHLKLKLNRCDTNYLFMQINKLNEKKETATSPEKKKTFRPENNIDSSTQKNKKLSPDKKKKLSPEKKKNLSPEKNKNSKVFNENCIVCSKKFTSYKNLYIHLREVHTANYFVCQFCDLVFINPHRLRKHLRRIHEKIKQKNGKIPKVSCDICSAVLIGYSALTTHKRTVHSDKKVKCDICGLDYKCSSYLKTHKRRVHSENGNFKCLICNKSYRSMRRLSIHRKGTHGKKS